jgi:hypothetical protein
VAAGEITGVVNDQAGAAVPGPTVTVTNVGTNQQRVVTSSGRGVYTAPSLAPGDYRVDVELPGFKPVRRDGIRLATGEKARIDFDLAVGDVREQVTVTADAPILRAETANLGTVVEHEAVGQLPLNGRTFITLASLGAWRGAAPELAAPTHQRRASSHERISLRRHLRAAGGAGSGGVLSGDRRDPGVQDREQQSTRRVRPLQRRRGESDHQGWRERLSRGWIRVPPQRNAQRPATTVGSIRTPFPGNTLTRMDPVALALLQRYPVPTAAGTANNYSRTDNEIDNQEQWDVRLDHKFASNRDQVFGRLSYFRDGFVPVSPLPDGRASSVFDASILTGPIANYPVADSFNRALERDYSNFGTIGTALDPRVVQLALKFVF